MLDRTLLNPSVPVSYVWLMLDVAAEHGVSQDQLMAGLDFPDELLHNPDARMPLRPAYATLCRRALALTNEPGLGYEFGLRANLTAHGIVGYGLMSQANLRQMLAFGERFGSVLRLSAWNLHFFVENKQVCMRAVESQPRNDLYRLSAQQVLVSCYTMLQQLIPECRSLVELHFNTPEPDYQSRFARRLPTCFFNASFNELRVPEHFLDQPFRTADQISAKLAERACSVELNAIHSLPHDALLRRVHTLLVPQHDGYPSLEDMANMVGLSPRTLSRHLQDEGTSYRELQQQALKRDSLTLLRDPHLSITEVAFKLGYSSMANFARACRNWHGLSPSALREASEQEISQLADKAAG